MSKFVLDANVALRWVLNEQHSDKALALRDDYQNGVHELLAPDVFPIEVANGLTRAERRHAIPQGQASILLADVMLASPVLNEAYPLLSRATELSSQSRASVFDCLYLVLAQDNQCQFVTADRKILNAFPGSPVIIELSSL